MDKLLKIATKNELGIAVPIASDIEDALVVNNVDRYTPRRGVDHTYLLGEQKKIMKSRYVESEKVLIGNNDEIGYPARWNKKENDSCKFDVVVTEKGDYGIRLSTLNTASYFPTYSFPLDEQNALESFDHVSLWVDTEDVDKLSFMSIAFNCPDSANKITVMETTTASLIKEVKDICGHGEITIPKHCFTVTGNPDFNNVKSMQVSIRAKTQGVWGSITFNSIKAVKSKPNNAKVLMRIDDGLGSVYDVAFPIFRKYNVPATCFVNPFFVSDNDERKPHISYDDSPAMTLKELKELHSAGWSICSHTYSHQLYNDPTVEGTATYRRRHYSQAYHDLSATQDWLIDNGFGDGATSHVYGNHYFNREVLDASHDLMLVDYSPKTVMTFFDTLPWGEGLRHVGPEKFFTRTSEGTYPYIDELVEKGGITVVMLHRFVGDGIGGSVSSQTLENAISYICMKEGVDFVTATDMAYATPVALR